MIIVNKVLSAFAFVMGFILLLITATKTRDPKYFAFSLIAGSVLIYFGLHGLNYI